MFLSRYLPRFLAIIILVIAGNAGRAGAQEKSRALEIFDAALSKFEADHAALAQWQYHQTLTTHQIDRNGKVVAKGTWKSIVRPGDPRPLEYTEKHVEGHLTFFQADSNENPRSPAHSSAPSPTDHSRQKNQVESTVDLVRKYNLRNRYNWQRLPDETVDGESAYVLSFSPKPNQNTSSREERFLALLAGKLWISRKDFTILQAKGALQAPCHLFWIIARVTTFQFTYHLGPAEGSRLLRPSEATAKTVVAFPFFAVRQQHWLKADHFEPRTPRHSANNPESGGAIAEIASQN